jgi:hypothetical protein
MTKEQLKALGLDDAAADKVAAEFAKELKEYVKKSDYDTLDATKKQLEKDVKTRDGQIESLKSSGGDAEALRKKVEDLQEENKKVQKESSAKIKKLQISNALDMAIAKSGALNSKAVKLLLTDGIDMDKAELDEKEGVKGIGGKLKELMKAEDSKMLFKAPEKHTLKGMHPGAASDDDDDDGEGGISNGAKFAQNYNTKFTVKPKNGGNDNG